MASSKNLQEKRSSVAPLSSAMPILRDQPPTTPGPLISEELQSLLDWNPPELRPQKHERGGSVTKKIGSRKFYDKHLTADLILNHFQYHPDLAAQIASTVDTAIKAALADGGKLPPPGGQLLGPLDRKEHIARLPHVMSKELPITVFYDKATSHLCIPIASTLALHPKHDRWLSLLAWNMVPNAGGFAIADGSLQILDFDDNELDDATKDILAGIKANMDPGMLETVRKLSAAYPDLAVWEMKSLTVGDEDVMLGIKRLASSGRSFNWTTCRCDGAVHKIDRMDAVENTHAGPDAPSTPWTIPEIYEESTQSTGVDADEFDDGDENESKGVAGDDNTSTVRASPPLTADRHYPTDSIVDTYDTEGEAVVSKDKGKSRVIDAGPSGVQKAGGSPTKRKRHDGRYQTLATVTAQSFVQQAWAQAVRTDSTIIVLHSGNHEFVCIRHRKSQTLYISDIIHPPTCKAPAYGKLHIGIYIAAVQDAIRRMEYGETLPVDKRTKLPSNFAKFNKKDRKDGGNDGKDGASGGGPSRGGTKRPKKDGDNDGARGSGEGKGTKPAKRGSRSKSGRRTRANIKLEREDQHRTILEANRRDILLIFLRYGIYDSPNPAAFFRKAPAILPLGQTPTPPPTPKPRKHYAAGTYSTIVITSEIGHGSTGKVHGGTFILNDAEHYIDLKVAVKLSFDEEEQERLLHEYFIYRHLNSKGVKGIPTALGLYVDPDDGPSALVLIHAGQSLYHRTSDIEYFQREAFQTTLKAIHAAGVLHGDIRSPNLLIDEFGESSIIDFDQAEKSDSETAQIAEFKQLARILEAEY